MAVVGSSRPRIGVATCRGAPDLDEDGPLLLAALDAAGVRREPLLAGQGPRRPVVVADVLGTVRPADPDDAQLAVARAALDAAPGGRTTLSHARVDVVPGPTGPVLLELEVTDCFLFLAWAAPEARARLAGPVLGVLAGDLSR